MKYILLTTLLLHSFWLSAQDLSLGRVASYSFTENAQDEAGSNHGIVRGAILSPDRFGNSNSAYKFDGIDDFIEIPNNPAINFGANEEFSISVWVNINPNQNDKEGSNNEILGKWNTSTNIGYPYAIRYWNTNTSLSGKNRIHTVKYDSRICGHTPLINSICEISSSVWHHLVFVKKGNQIEFFQDGILQGTEPDNTSLACNTKNTNPLYIGKRDGNQRYFTGMVDDLLIYNRAITREEINLLLTEKGWQAEPISQDINFLSFTIPEQIGVSGIDKENQTINLDVVCGTDIKNLIPGFSLSVGASVAIDGVSQSSGISKVDFTQPVTYIVNSENQCIPQEWVVFVHQKNPDQEYVDLKTAFLSFTFPEQTGSAIINFENHKIELEVECSADLSALAAIFALPKGARSKVSGNIQQSGISINDFTHPVVFQNYNYEECAIQDWTVHVRLKKGSEAEKNNLTTIRSFSVLGQTRPAVIDIKNYTVLLEIPCHSEIKNQTPLFLLPEGSIAIVSGQPQKSGISTQDFSDFVIYRIANDDNCVFQDWKIIISKEGFTKENIDRESEEFKIPNVFTPNGDDKNETFQVGTFFIGSKILIYNRFGKLVYQNHNYENQFNGQNLTTGTYFYSIRNPCSLETFKGYFLIKRK